jgi:NAD-dependent DNA ligase
MQAAFATLGLPADAPPSEARQAWIRLSLQHHPDRGGDAALFREVHTAFESIRNQKAVRPAWADLTAEEDAGVPSYSVIVAKTGRGKCSKSGELIPEGALKCGSWVKELGQYGRWRALANWTLPYAIWAHVKVGDPESPEDFKSAMDALGSLEDVCLAGSSLLSPEQREALARHLLTGPRAKRTMQPEAPKLADAADAADAGGETTAFTAPKCSGPELPAVEGKPFENKTLVLTGVFGGGGGLSAGKPQLKAWIEKLGGKVSGSLSKKTSFLVVGIEPGAAKVSQADSLSVALATVESLVEAAREGDVAKAATSVEIESFSSGFGAKRARLM